MQVNDIFILGVNIAHAGMDQRKAHVIARDVASKMRVTPLRDAKGAQIKPVCVHHPLLLGLNKPAVWPPPEGADLTDFWASMKMSEVREVVRALRPRHRGRDPREGAQGVLPARLTRASTRCSTGRASSSSRATASSASPAARPTAATSSSRRPKSSTQAYLAGALHPADLKNGIADWLVDTLAPAREAFASPDKQALIAELDQLITR